MASPSDLAVAILDIAKQMNRRRSVQWGVYHYCGRGVTTWHEFAKAICELGEKHSPIRVKEIKAISTNEYPTAAKRRPYSALDCFEIERSFGIQMRPWQDSLAEMIKRIFAR